MMRDQSVPEPASGRSDPSEAAERGAFAASPLDFTWQAWRAILGRVWINSGRHSIGFLAAGVAFYGFLSFIPALGLLVMIYGWVAEPSTLFAQMTAIIRLVPADSAELINEQLANLIKTAAVTKGLALIPALAISLYGASGAASGVISSLNIVYEQEEKRSFLRLLLVAVALMVATVLIGLLGLVSASALWLLQSLLGGLGPIVALAVRILTWLLTAGIVSFVIAGMYRYAPCRHRAKWRWLSLGSVIATVLWLIGSVLFGLYAGYANYSTTYGSLGAVVALLMWFFVSAYAVMLGAFVDAEAERQTGQDSTTGPDRPVGKRGAVVADSIAAVSPGGGQGAAPGQG